MESRYQLIWVFTPRCFLLCSLNTSMTVTCQNVFVKKAYDVSRMFHRKCLNQVSYFWLVFILINCDLLNPKVHLVNEPGIIHLLTYWTLWAYLRSSFGVTELTSHFRVIKTKTEIQTAGKALKTGTCRAINVSFTGQVVYKANFHNTLGHSIGCWWVCLIKCKYHSGLVWSVCVYVIFFNLERTPPYAFQE